MTIVVFDIGKVLVPEGDRVPRLVNFITECGLPVDTEALMNAYWAHRDAYDLGMSDEEYWPKVLLDAGLSPTEIEHVDSAALGALDGERNSATTSETSDFLAELHAAEVPVALLSNAPHSMARAVRTSPWAQEIAAQVFSSEVGVAKPSQEIFRIAEREIEKSFGPHKRDDVVFFDDRPVNIEGAQAFGWQGQLWKGVGPARTVLANVLT